MEDTRKTKDLEEFGIVIDYLPTGKFSSASSFPLVQLVCEKYFTLLEASVKKGADIKIGERVYIGKGERDKIDKIKGKIDYSELTTNAKDELREALAKIIESDEKRFVEFFNKAGPLNIREHTLELLPGVGKKHLNQILAEREKQPFSSLSEINQRVPLLPDVKKMIVDRIIEEMSTQQRYYLFIKKYDAKPYQTY